MGLKFSRTAYPYKQSDLQRKQWQQFAAIGYSIAIRGYLLCWHKLLKDAGFSPDYLECIDEAIAMSRVAEKRARWQMKHLRIL